VQPWLGKPGEPRIDAEGMWAVGRVRFMKSAAWHVAGGRWKLPPAAYYLPPTTYYLPGPRCVPSNHSTVAECITIPNRKLVVLDQKVGSSGQKVGSSGQKVGGSRQFSAFLTSRHPLSPSHHPLRTIPPPESSHFRPKKLSVFDRNPTVFGDFARLLRTYRDVGQKKILLGPDQGVAGRHGPQRGTCFCGAALSTQYSALSTPFRALAARPNSGIMDAYRIGDRPQATFVEQR